MAFLRRAGINLIEVAVAAAILVTVATGFAAFQAATVRMNQNERDRTFALQKATQIMEELKAKAQAGAEALDDYGQGETTYSLVLTTEGVAANAPLSDNPTKGLGYRFVRQIEVTPLPRDKGSRQVTVRIYLSDGRVSPPGKLGGYGALATLTNIFKTPPVVVVPTQQYTVYNFYLEQNNGRWENSSYWNPNWWQGFLNNGITYLGNANNGFTIDLRPIYKQTFGRDPFYAPLTNQNDYYTNYRDARDFHMSAPGNVPMNMVYFRPGNNSSGWETFISTAHFQKILANANQVGAQLPLDHEWDNNYKRFLENTDWYYNQNSTLFSEEQRAPTIADQHNHAVRYIEHYEKQWLWDHNLAYTVRGLLDGMLGGQIRNPIITNVLGEHFPVMPLRNFSDAARVPAEKTTKSLLASRWGVVDATLTNSEIDMGSNARLVTHPLKLETGLGEDVEFRVFPYKTRNISDAENAMKAAYRSGIVVLRARVDQVSDSHHILPDFNNKLSYGLSNYLLGGITSNFTVEVCEQGASKYAWKEIWPNTSTTVSSTYLASPVTVVTASGNGYEKGDVVINLKNIPYTHKKVGTTTINGLPDNVDLYGYNYFPDPLLPTMGYDPSVAGNPEDQVWTGKEPRNTARFRIRFKVNSPVIVESITTIGSEPILTKHQAPNRSRSWSWVGLAAPESERIQMMGDPRHNPHLDVRLDERYNRFFADLTTSAYGITNSNQGYNNLGIWNRFPDTAAGWGPNPGGVGRVEYDAPRYLELWRNAIMRSGAMFFQPGPWGLRYMLLGDEFFPTWSYSQKPYTGIATLGGYDERDNPTIAADKNAATDATKWYARPWLGDLSPDDAWDDWRDHGNLSADDYRRMDVRNIKGFQDDAKFKHTRRVDNWGMLSLLNSNMRFSYTPGGVSAPLTEEYGKPMSKDMRASLNSSVPAGGYFSMNDGGETLPSDWSFAPFANNRTVLEPGLPAASQSYYGASSDRMLMTPIAIRSQAGDQAGYFVFSSVLGAWNTMSDPNTLWRTAFTSIFQGLMDMGGPTYAASGTAKSSPARIRLLPRLKLLTPEDDSLVQGSSLLIQWEKQWKRWDEKPYSRLYPDFNVGFSQPLQMVYQLSLSDDSGKNFKYLDNTGNLTATAAGFGLGARYQNRSDLNVMSESYLLNLTPLKTKQYQVRIEGYRYDPSAPYTYERLHHSYVQLSINVVK